MELKIKKKSSTFLNQWQLENSQFGFINAQKNLNSIDPVEPVAELATNKTRRKQDKLFEVVKTDKTAKLKHLLKEWSLSSSFQCLTKLYQYENRFIRIIKTIRNQIVNNKN